MGRRTLCRREPGGVAAGKHARPAASQALGQSRLAMGAGGAGGPAALAGHLTGSGWHLEIQPEPRRPRHHLGTAGVYANPAVLDRTRLAGRQKRIGYGRLRSARLARLAPSPNHDLPDAALHPESMLGPRS